MVEKRKKIKEKKHEKNKDSHVPKHIEMEKGSFKNKGVNNFIHVHTLTLLIIVCMLFFSKDHVWTLL